MEVCLSWQRWLGWIDCLVGARPEDSGGEEWGETGEVIARLVMDKKRMNVLALISSGQISRAIQRVTSPVWHAWMIQPSGNGWSRSFQPGGTFCLKVSPSIVQLIMWEVWETPGSAPGCGGMRPEHLQVVGHKPEEEDDCEEEIFLIGSSQFGWRNKPSQSSRLNKWYMIHDTWLWWCQYIYCWIFIPIIKHLPIFMLILIGKKLATFEISNFPIFERG